MRLLSAAAIVSTAGLMGTRRLARGGNRLGTGTDGLLFASGLSDLAKTRLFVDGLPRLSPLGEGGLMGDREVLRETTQFKRLPNSPGAKRCA